jgi:HD-GYP domain-containing protein (c-di-GMP phosphodiesterase class II)
MSEVFDDIQRMEATSNTISSKIVKLQQEVIDALKEELQRREMKFIQHKSNMDYLTYERKSLTQKFMDTIAEECQDSPKEVNEMHGLSNVSICAIAHNSLSLKDIRSNSSHNLPFVVDTLWFLPKPL